MTSSDSSNSLFRRKKQNDNMSDAKNLSFDQILQKPSFKKLFSGMDVENDI